MFSPGAKRSYGHQCAHTQAVSYITHTHTGRMTERPELSWAVTWRGELGDQRERTKQEAEEKREWQDVARAKTNKPEKKTKKTDSRQKLGNMICLSNCKDGCKD